MDVDPKVDLGCLYIELASHHFPLNSEPDRAVWRFDGKIGLVVDDAGAEVDIGRMTVYRLVPQVASDAGISLCDALDCISEDLAHYTELVEDGHVRQAVRDYYTDIFSDDLLIIDEIEIEPAYRGHRIGLLAMRHAIDMAQDGSLVTTRPFPLEFRGMDDGEWRAEHPGLGEEDFQRAQGALRRYVELIGFEQYPPSDLWCLTTAHIIPSLDDIVEGKLRVASDQSKRERPRRRAHHRHGTARERA
jgi:GNAT superfamily N-acetyltransferase